MIRKYYLEKDRLRRRHSRRLMRHRRKRSRGKIRSRECRFHRNSRRVVRPRAGRNSWDRIPALKIKLYKKHKPALYCLRWDTDVSCDSSAHFDETRDETEKAVSSNAPSSSMSPEPCDPEPPSRATMLASSSSNVSSSKKIN